MKVDELIKALLNLESVKLKSDDSVPKYLSEKYDREGAAIALGEIEDDSPKVIHALCLACLNDVEEDVRLTAFESLLKIDRRVAVIIAHSLVEDDYEDISELARESIDTWPH